MGKGLVYERVPMRASAAEVGREWQGASCWLGGQLQVMHDLLVRGVDFEFTQKCSGN